MNKTVSVSPEKLSENAFDLIGKKWMLITVCKNDGTFNQMTASWGGLGVLWGKNVCFAFIRPERYTYGFAEDDDSTWTFTFFDEEHRDKLAYCGRASGRDTDKAAACGLTPVRLESGAVTYEQARLTVVGRKLYSDELKESGFTGSEELAYYKNAGYHKMYVCEISDILKQE